MQERNVIIIQIFLKGLSVPFPVSFQFVVHVVKCDKERYRTTHELVKEFGKEGNESWTNPKKDSNEKRTPKQELNVTFLVFRYRH